MCKTIADNLKSQASAWACAESFAKNGGIRDYTLHRNIVSSDLSEVSILSPAIRHRLITEYDLADFALATEGPEKSLKYRQEVFWRIYWKSWLQQRPSIWQNWLTSFKSIPDSEAQRAAQVINGESEVQLMNFFAQQLIETGYLHNHARMWFAGFWVHHLRLPWELGARFFMTHLLDGDPASNTLSWRWVAGLHTKGKVYQTGESNIRKFLNKTILETQSENLEQLQYQKIDTQQNFVEHPEPAELHDIPSSYAPVSENEKVGIWIHEDDLDFASSPIGSIKPKAVFVGAYSEEWHKLNISKKRVDYLDSILKDAANRSKTNYQTTIAHSMFEANQSFHDQFKTWSTQNEIDTIFYLEPFVGPAQSACVRLQSLYPEINWRPLRRPSDSKYLPLAKSGFFNFWKKVEKLNENPD